MRHASRCSGVALVMASLVAFVLGCSGTSLPLHPPVTFTFVNLPPLAAGTEGHYGLWAVVNGQDTLLGNFQVDTDGRIRGMDGGPIAGFETAGVADDATQLVLAVEPDMQEGTRLTTHTPHFYVPSLLGSGQQPAIPLLSGNATGTGLVTLSFNLPFNGASRGASIYATATGTFALATPTQSPPDRALGGAAGLWFIDPLTGKPGLSLPPLSLLYEYRAWLETAAGPLEIGGMPGIHSSGVEQLHPGGFFDDSGIYSATAGSAALDSFLDYPGEDFLFNSPDPVAFPFPLSVRGATVLVSLDPVPMVADHPFLPLLTATVPQSFPVRTQGISMSNLFSALNGSKFPAGVVKLF